jgi:hypothetical protein
MKKTMMNKKKNNNLIDIKNIKDFTDGFERMLSVFSGSAESILKIITGSFDNTRKRSEEITSLFAQTRSEAESIFSIFSGIISIFSGSGGGGILSSLLGLIPGGGLITSILGSSHAHSGIAPQVNVNIPQSGTNLGTIYVPALPKEGYYKIHKLGKEQAELRPAR